MSSSACRYIKSDLFRYKGHCAFAAFLKTYLTNRGFNYCVWLRLAQHGKACRLPARIMLFFKKRCYGIYISHKTAIGYGLYIGHNGPVVINPAAVIGNNVNLSQYTTIGSNTSEAAVIGDEVYIGPSVCIVGAVSVGSGATIGAGSVVTKNIPENTTAVGNPAKVLHDNRPGRYILNRWEI